MIKIVIPKSYKIVEPYFQEPEHKKSLYMTAVDDEKLLAILRFMVRGTTVKVYDILSIEPNLDKAVTDGLIRTTLFQAEEMGCECCQVYNVPENLEDYFKNHGFLKMDNYFEHLAYVDEFFKPCPGCSDAKQ